MNKKHELQQRESWLKELYKGSGRGRASDYAPLVIDDEPPVAETISPPPAEAPAEYWEKLSREEMLQMAAEAVAEMEAITGKYKRPAPAEIETEAPATAQVLPVTESTSRRVLKDLPEAPLNKLNSAEKIQALWKRPPEMKKVIPKPTAQPKPRVANKTNLTAAPGVKNETKSTRNGLSLLGLSDEEVFLKIIRETLKATGPKLVIAELRKNVANTERFHSYRLLANKKFVNLFTEKNKPIRPENYMISDLEKMSTQY